MEAAKENHEEFEFDEFDDDYHNYCDDSRDFSDIDDHSSQKENSSQESSNPKEENHSSQQKSHSKEKGTEKDEAKEEEEFNAVQRYLVSKEYPLHYSKDQKRALRRKVKRWVQQSV